MSANFCVELSDDVVERAKHGELDACEQIYRAFEAPAYTLAFRICQSHELAEEVLQDAMICVMKKINQFRGDAPFWSWVRRIVSNTALMQLRKKKHFVPIDDIEEQERVDQRHDDYGDQLDLSHAFSKLSDTKRAIVWLYDVEGYSHQEISEMLGKSLSYSKTMLFRARKELQGILNGGFKDSDSSLIELRQ